MISFQPPEKDGYLQSTLADKSNTLVERQEMAVSATGHQECYQEISVPSLYRAQTVLQPR